MNITISEVQITCSILLIALTLVLSFFLPRYVETRKIVEHARKFLTFCAALMSIHFIIQYFIQKFFPTFVNVREIINLFFCFPASYLTNISLLYLLRQGFLLKKEWLFPLILYVLSIFSILIAIPNGNFILPGIRGTWFAAILYAISIIFCNILQIKEYIHIVKANRYCENNTYQAIIKWTNWSVYLLAIGGFMMPIMILSTNLTLRSIYGIFSLLVVFFYVFSFIGYALTDNVSVSSVSIAQDNKTHKQKEKDCILEKDQHPHEKKRIEIETAISNFVQSRNYTETGITLKDVATEIGITRYALNNWLQTTEFKQFNNWLMSLRIDEAKRLMLEHPDWSNETVSKACGFSNRTYFQSQFNDRVGMTPCQWVKENIH